METPDEPKRKRKYQWSQEGRQSFRARMQAMNADPEFKEKISKLSRARMQAMHADPEFNPLANLTKEQREDYDILRKNGGYTRAEALSLVSESTAI